MTGSLAAGGPTELETRLGLPPELRILVEKFPRDVWSRLDAGGVGAFWLQRHARFRDMGDRLSSLIADYREDRLEADEFAEKFAPRLQLFLGELDGHHRVEDLHYFPLFKRLESRLERGFEILDHDHHTIHEALERNAAAANAFLSALEGDKDRLRRRGDDYAGENERLVGLLSRHLEDEEDLIIPVILDRGEAAIG